MPSRLSWTCVAPMCALVAWGCAATPPAAPASSRSVASRDASGDLIVARRDESLPGGWLTGLARGDVLVYRIEGDDIAVAAVRYRVERLVRRGRGVAVLLKPHAPPPLDPPPVTHWLAGDEEGLYRLSGDAALVDPELVPLTADGHVLPDAREAPLWRVPPEWRGEPAQGEHQGWSVELLSMVLEGPVRGDRCAYIRRAPPAAERLTVCGNVGLVERRVGPEEQPRQHWTLVEITRATP